MKRTFAFLMTLALTLAACSASDGESGPTTQADGLAGEEGALQEATPEATTSDGERVLVGLDLVEGRRVIRRATLELHASDTRSTYEDIVAMVEAIGGFVADATVFPISGDDDQPRVSLTLRVPVDQLNVTMTAIKALADEIVSESQGAEDVSEQFVDLEARLTNLQTLETELRALLEEVRRQENADPEKLLRVFNEVSSVRGQIEQIQGQLDYLSDLTELATLEIQITQTPTTVPIVDEPWSPAEAVRDALRSLVSGLEAVADWAIGFALYALPMLLITIGPLALIGLIIYRRLFRKGHTTPAPIET
jgi:lysozyme family protein